VVRRVYVAVVGPGNGPEALLTAAEAVGRALARAGAVVVCGGLGGVMAAVSRGARQEGGITVGILPGPDRRDANEWLEVAVPTGMGEARNAIVVGCADAVIALGGGYGTLSEIALALKLRRPVICLESWDISGVDAAADPAEAVAKALEQAQAPPSSQRP
jgi:uncharacterized protein (TIGR00725 family)